jgi:hypothetical protein
MDNQEKKLQEKNDEKKHKLKNRGFHPCNVHTMGRKCIDSSLSKLVKILKSPRGVENIF